MTVEKFLSFWSQHNIEIIESVIALVIILSLFLAYRSFFAKSSRDAEGEEHGFDASQIEQVLQKILANQNQSQPDKPSHEAEDLGMRVDFDAMDTDSGAGASSEVVQQLQSTVSESQKKIETLQIQLKEALQKASELAENSGGAANSIDTESLKNKISDLEARLSEYEIISQDIADLSRYRDENEQLKREIEALKSSSGSVAMENPLNEPEVSTPALAEEASSEPVSASEPDLDLEAMVAEMAGSQATTEAATESPSPDLIDDELMKEFAAAVEGQKASGKAAAKPANDSESAAQSGAETDPLMDEFENFVSKKS